MQVKRLLADGSGLAPGPALVAKVTSAYNCSLHSAINMAPRAALAIGRALLTAEKDTPAHIEATKQWTNLVLKLQSSHNRTRGGEKAAVATAAFQIGDIIRTRKLAGASRGSVAAQTKGKPCAGKIQAVRDHDFDVFWITEGPFQEASGHVSKLAMSKDIVKDTALLPPVF
jgi:hypothetical protein